MKENFTNILTLIDKDIKMNKKKISREFYTFYANEIEEINSRFLKLKSKILNETNYKDLTKDFVNEIKRDKEIFYQNQHLRKEQIDKLKKEKDLVSILIKDSIADWYKRCDILLKYLKRLSVYFQKLEKIASSDKELSPTMKRSGNLWLYCLLKLGDWTAFESAFSNIFKWKSSVDFLKKTITNISKNSQLPKPQILIETLISQTEDSIAAAKRSNNFDEIIIIEKLILDLNRSWDFNIKRTFFLYHNWENNFYKDVEKSYNYSNAYGESDGNIRSLKDPIHNELKTILKDLNNLKEFWSFEKCTNMTDQEIFNIFLREEINPALEQKEFFDKLEPLMNRNFMSLSSSFSIQWHDNHNDIQTGFEFDDSQDKFSTFDYWPVSPIKKFKKILIDIFSGELNIPYGVLIYLFKENISKNWTSVFSTIERQTKEIVETSTPSSIKSLILQRVSINYKNRDEIESLFTFPYWVKQLSETKINDLSREEIEKILDLFIEQQEKINKYAIDSGKYCDSVRKWLLFRDFSNIKQIKLDDNIKYMSNLKNKLLEERTKFE